MPLVALLDVCDILVDLLVEHVEPAVLLHLVRAADVVLDGLLLLGDLFLQGLIAWSWDVGSREQLSPDSRSVARGIRLNQLDVGILANRCHVGFIVAL